MDEAAAARRPTKLVLVAVGLFVLAVFLGRLLVAGGAAWGLLVLALPLVLAAGSAAVGWRAAVVLTALFAAAVLGVRAFVLSNPAGWAALLLLPVVAFTAMLVGNVLGKMRRRDADLAAAQAQAAEDAEAEAGP